MQTAVILPAYNEEQTIRQVIRDFKKILPDADIYVYDNNSVDNTKKLAEEEGVNVCSQTIQGKGAVLRKAFEEIDADVYVITDADCTYPPDKIPDMIRMVIEDGCDMVVGNRLKKYLERSHSIVKMTGNSIFPAIFSILYHCPEFDVLSGSRVFSRKFVKSFPAEYDGFETETEMNAYCVRQKLKLNQLEIPYQDRPAGSTAKIKAFEDGWKIIKAMFAMKKKAIPPVKEEKEEHSEKPVKP